MVKLVFGMIQSLDGYVDHTAFAPSPTLAGPRPRLRWVTNDRIDEDVIRLVYVPA